VEWRFVSGLFQLAGKALLSEGLVEHNGDAIGEIQGAGFFMEKRYAQPAFGVVAINLRGQPCRFTAKNEVIFRLVFNLCIMARPAGFNEPEPCIMGQSRGKITPAFPATPGQVIPVIHAGAFEVAIIQLEAERFN